MLEQGYPLSLAALAGFANEGGVQELAVADHILVEIVGHEEGLREVHMIG